METKEFEKNFIEMIKSLKTVEGFYQNVTVENLSYKLVQAIKSKEFEKIPQYLEKAETVYDILEMTKEMSPELCKKKRAVIKDVREAMHDEPTLLRGVEPVNLPEVTEYKGAKPQDIKPKPEVKKAEPKTGKADTGKEKKKRKEQPLVQEKASVEEKQVERMAKTPPIVVDYKEPDSVVSFEKPSVAERTLKLTKVTPKQEHQTTPDPKVQLEALEKRKAQEAASARKKFAENYPVMNKLLGALKLNDFSEFETKVLGNGEAVGIEKLVKRNGLARLTGHSSSKVQEYCKKEGIDIGLSSYELLSKLSQAFSPKGPDIQV